MFGRPGTDFGIDFLVLPFFRLVNLGKAPYLPEPQLPHLDDVCDTTYVTRLLCCKVLQTKGIIIANNCCYPISPARDIRR